MSEERDMFGGGSIAIGKVTADNSVYIQARGSKYGYVVKIRLTPMEARGLCSILEDVINKNGCVVMGLKNPPERSTEPFNDKNLEAF